MAALETHTSNSDDGALCIIIAMFKIIIRVQTRSILLFNMFSKDSCAGLGLREEVRLEPISSVHECRIFCWNAHIIVNRRPFLLQ